MSFRVADMKWGTPTVGTPSGEISWASDLTGGLEFDTSRYSLADFDNALQAAFDAWENAAAVDFEMVGSFASADIQLEMTALPGSVVGRAITTFQVLSGTDRIVESDITFDTRTPSGGDRLWAPYGDNTGLSFYAVALHEIGHAIGLEHVDDETEIMNDTVSANDLGDGDVLGARALYGSDPGDVGGDPSPDNAPIPAPSDTIPGSEDDGGDGSDGLAALGLAAVLAALGAFLGPAVAAVGMAVGLGLAGSGSDDSTGFATSNAGNDDPDGDIPDGSGEVLLSDLIPILEPDEVELDMVIHTLSDCDGCCGGSCGDPEHSEAITTDWA